jgi:hypothetical protein
MGKCLRIGLAGLVLWPALASAAAGEVMYARSNGDLAQYESPGKYDALNVLDGDASTAWCSEGTGQDASLEIQLARRVSIDRLEIAVGLQAGGRFKAFNRPRMIELVEGDTLHPFELADRPGQQTVEFDPPLNGDRLVLRFRSVHRGENRSTCITDLILYRGKQALNGGKLSPMKGLKERRSLLDAWVTKASQGSRRELILGLSDAYRFVYVPSEDADDEVVKAGVFRLQAGQLQLKDGKEWIPVRLERDDAGRVVTLGIEAEPFAGHYTRRTPSHQH